MKNLLMVGFFLASSLFAVDGYEVYKKNCQVCHVEMLGKRYTFAHLHELSAPPMALVSENLKEDNITTDLEKSLDRHLFINFVKDYIVNPNHEKSVCKSGIISSFGTMPSLKGKLTESERQAVAEWLYDRYKNNKE